jgi:hypothetical protein
MSSQAVKPQVKQLDGFNGIGKGYMENTLVVWIKPRGKIWSSTDYERKISEAFEVEYWKVWLQYVNKIGREITLAFKVENTTFIGEEIW